MKSFCLFLGLATSSVYASYSGSTEHRLAKRDPSGVEATNTYQNCVVHNLNFHAKRGGHQKCDDGIQVGECHENSRVNNQVFAVFEPTIGGNKDYEGAWYGNCCAYDIYPEDSDMGEVANPNYICMTWETSDKKQGNGPPTMPQTKITPFPIICPSTLENCYAKDYYSPGQKMAAYGNHVTTFTGLWGSPKSPKNKDGSGGGIHQWCDHICGGCKVGTWYEMKSDQIKKLQCDIKSCKEYKGNTQAKVNIQTVGTLPPVNVAATCKNDYDVEIIYSDVAGAIVGSGKVPPRTPVPFGSGGKGQGNPPKEKGGNGGQGGYGGGSGGGSGKGDGGEKGKDHGKSKSGSDIPTNGTPKAKPKVYDSRSPQYEDKSNCGEEIVSNVHRRHLHQSGKFEASLF